MQHELIIAGKQFSSRLFLGTGKFGSPQTMQEAVVASGTQLVTLALKRIDLVGETRFYCIAIHSCRSCFM